jgi:hypothetical protein
MGHTLIGRLPPGNTDAGDVDDTPGGAANRTAGRGCPHGPDNPA